LIALRLPVGTFATSNITVPLSLVLQTPDRSFFGVDFFFGGYYSYRFAGKQGKDKMDFENIFNRHESGLIVLRRGECDSFSHADGKMMER